MNRAFESLGVAVLIAGASLHGAEFRLDGQVFTLPPGFVIERVAGPGLVERPIEGDFDEAGRFYVSDSSGSNDPVAKQLKDKPHRILRLEDSDGNGVFDKSVVYADKLMFPEGAMWLDGSLYVSAPPVIWKLTDTDGDGVADKREEWLDAKTLTGCANDLHGPYNGLDGWIYWCKGAFAEQSYEQQDGSAFQTRAAHIFRRRPEGGLIEAVMTGGMDNPVEVAFTPEGERLFTTTFLQHPGGGKRDGVIHAIYGGVYGKIHDVIDGHARTGDLMPVMTHLGAAAPCGLISYQGDEFEGNLFVCSFNMHKVTRHVLREQGGTFSTKDSDFLVSDSTDFHPTDVIEDADGSLLIINTGGWYKLCCPTSQLWKPDVLGAIYRVRRVDARKVADPRGVRLEWTGVNAEELARRLGDSRWAVVQRATRTLRNSDGAEKVLEKILKTSAGVKEKRAAIWALTGRAGGKNSASVRMALKDADPSVRHTALQSISVGRDREGAQDVQELLGDMDAHVRRAAAEALGRIGNAQNVAALLEGAGRLKGSEGELPDRVQEHSLVYALIEIHSAPETGKGLISENPFAKRAAMIALDQMSGGHLGARDVVPLLSSKNSVLKQTANWIVAHHPEWGAELASFFATRFQVKASDPAGDEEMVKQLAGLASSRPIQELLSKAALSRELSEGKRVLALQAMKRAGLAETPEDWSKAVAQVLGDGQGSVSEAALGAAGSFSYKKVPPELKDALLTVALDDRGDITDSARLQALSALPSGMQLSDGVFEFLCKEIAPERTFAERSSASGILAKARLSDPQLIALADILKDAGPIEVPRLLPAISNSVSERVGMVLIASLKDSRGLGGLQSDRVREAFAKYPESVKAKVENICAILNEEAGKQAAHLDELLPKLEGGDVRRGQAIFNSAKAGCSTCHAIGYLGGNLGPDLTSIGRVRTQRDLLEAVVYPSASFVRSYEPVIVKTKSGDEYSGVLRKDAADEVVIGTGPGAEVRVARNEIEETRPGKTSVMPQGFAEQLTAGELADLLAFLKGTR